MFWVALFYTTLEGVWWTFLDASCSCDVYVLNFFLRGDFDLLENDDDDLLFVRLCFSFFFGDLEGLCERPITSLSTEGCLTKTPPSWANLSFSHYYCLPLFGTNNRDRFLKN